MQTPPNTVCQTLRQPPTPSTPTQASHTAEDNTLSARILEEITHCRDFHGSVYQNTVILENECVDLRRQLKDKDAETLELRGWQDWWANSGPECQRRFNDYPQLQETKDRLEREVDAVEVRNVELQEQKTKDIEKLKSQHQGQVAQIRDQHGQFSENLEATIADLSSDASKLREGFADLSAANKALQIEKDDSEKKEQEAVRERNRAVSAEREVRGKLDQERRDHNSQLRTKQELIDEIKQSKDSLETEKNSAIEKLGQLIRDTENELDKSESKGTETAAEALVARQQLSCKEKELETETIARKQAETKVTAKEEELGRALCEISKLRGQLKESQSSLEEETAKARQAEAKLAQERKEREDDDQDLHKFLAARRKRCQQPSTEPEEEPPMKKQCT